MASSNLTSALKHSEEAARTVGIIKAVIERRYPPDEGLDLLIQSVELELKLLHNQLNQLEKE